MEKPQKDKKSTVLTIKENNAWGMSLYNACYVFNFNFANYALEYAKKYENGEIKYDEIDLSEKLEKKRNDLINQQHIMKEDVVKKTKLAISTYRKYAKTLPVGRCVSHWRNHESMDDYIKIINEREKLNVLYHQCRIDEYQAKKRERKFIDEHKFSTRELGYQIKNLEKKVKVHSHKLDYAISDDIQKIYELLISEEMAEKLMGVCLNILNTYSEKDFTILMSNQDKEHVADYIYDFFFNFKHNYDFIAGCYELGEDDKLHLKNIEQLKTKIYNGYYFTIRGFVQSSYSMARSEHFNIESTDKNWLEEEHTSNHGIDNYTNTEDFVVAPKHQGISRGLIDYWNLCKQYLMDHTEDMSKEFVKIMSDKFKRIDYYKNNNMNDYMIKMLEKINKEISSGRDIGNQFKHIVLDSLGGAESKEEWKCCTEITTQIISKYMQKFFEDYNKEDVY